MGLIPFRAIKSLFFRRLRRLKKTFGANHFLFLLVGTAHKQKKKMIRSKSFFADVGGNYEFIPERE
jgi:hypothetical protein